METFFVAVTACALLALGAVSLLAARRLLTLTRLDPTQRRPGDD